jgi:hypothetical protein
MWSLRSKEVCIETDNIELSLPIAYEPDPSVYEGRQHLNYICKHMLSAYGKYVKRMTCDTGQVDENGKPIEVTQPVLAAYIILTSPLARTYCLPTLQFILESELEPEDYVVDRISWQDAQIASDS